MRARLNQWLAKLIVWLLPIASLAYSWNYLPTSQMKLALLSLTIITVALTMMRKVSFPRLGITYFVFLFLNLVQLRLAISATVITSIVLASLIAVGLLQDYLVHQRFRLPELTNLMLLAFLSAQIHSLLIYWPFGFSEKALLDFIGYYIFWQYLEMYETADRQSVIRHFAFTALTVMVVLGFLIWTNFPQLKIF